MRSVISGDVLNVLRNTSYMYQLGWDQRVCLGTTHAVSRSVWTCEGIVATVSPCFAVRVGESDALHRCGARRFHFCEADLRSERFDIFGPLGISMGYS